MNGKIRNISKHSREGGQALGWPENESSRIVSLSQKASMLKDFYSFKLRDEIIFKQNIESTIYWFTGITHAFNAIYLADQFNSRICKLKNNRISILDINIKEFQPHTILYFNDLIYVSDFKYKNVHIFDPEFDLIDTISFENNHIDYLTIACDENEIYLVTIKKKNFKQSIKLYSFYEINRISLKSSIKLNQNWVINHFFINNSKLYLGSNNGIVINISQPNEYSKDFSISEYGIGATTDYLKVKQNWFFIDHMHNQIIKISEDKKRLFKWTNTLGGWLIKFKVIENHLFVTTGDYNNINKIYIYDI